MRNKLFGRILLASLAALGLFFAFGHLSQPAAVLGAGKTFALQPPGFVRNAQASTSYFDIAAKLDEEAGISAWFKSPDAINLAQVRGQFRTIELETADYIVGSVAVPNYIENFDVHVYVNKSGWILAYYLRGDLTSKIVDAKSRSINTTKLKTVVSAVAGAAGAPFTDVAYYDFRYPNATNMLLVAEDVDNGNDFAIQLPSNYGYFERGWALYCQYDCQYFSVDGINKTSQAWCVDRVCYGGLTASELLPDVTHTIAVSAFGYAGYGVLVMTYRVP